VLLNTVLIYRGNVNSLEIFVYNFVCRPVIICKTKVLIDCISVVVDIMNILILDSLIFAFMFSSASKIKNISPKLYYVHECIKYDESVRTSGSITICKTKVFIILFIIRLTSI
jgi:hypothetical protein